MLLGTNNLVYYFNPLKKKVRQDSGVTKDYTPKKKTTMFAFPYRNPPKDNKKYLSVIQYCWGYSA